MEFHFLKSSSGLGIRPGVFCDSGVKKNVPQYSCDTSIRISRALLTGSHYEILYASSCSGYPGPYGSPEKGGSLQMLVWNFWLLTMLMFLRYANRFFLYLISHLKESWSESKFDIWMRRVFHNPASFSCLLLFFLQRLLITDPIAMSASGCSVAKHCAHIPTAAKFACTGMGDVAHYTASVAIVRLIMIHWPSPKKKRYL